MKIAVIGATGLLGEPVARQLKADGYDVRAISRDIAKARQKLGDGFEYAQADLEDFSTALLEQALDGCNGLHLNLNSNSDERCRAIEYYGVEKAGKAAKKAGLKKISWITGNYEPNLNHPWTRRAIKSQGIETLMNCGVPWMIFGCTWFMESLPWFIKDGRATMIGEQPFNWHWLHIGDYAAMVSLAYSTAKTDNRLFVMHGPQPLKMLDALKTYCSIVDPKIPVEGISIREAHERAKQPGMEWLDRFADFMEKFEVYSERGDPTETYSLLGKPELTVEEWAQRVARDGK